LELYRSNDFHFHDRLQNNSTSLLVGFSERTDSCHPESQLGRIDDVGGTILQDEASVSNRVTGERAFEEGFAESLASEGYGVRRIGSSKKRNSNAPFQHQGYTE
jgi:hypothetical protein